jgi:hypothetical protein
MAYTPCWNLSNLLDINTRCKCHFVLFSFFTYTLPPCYPTVFGIHQCNGSSLQKQMYTLDCRGCFQVYFGKGYPSNLAAVHSDTLSMLPLICKISSQFSQPFALNCEAFYIYFNLLVCLCMSAYDSLCHTFTSEHSRQARSCLLSIGNT